MRGRAAAALRAVLDPRRPPGPLAAMKFKGGVRRDPLTSPSPAKAMERTGRRVSVDQERAARTAGERRSTTTADAALT